MLMIEFERGDTMKKFDTYMVNKIFTVPYLDRMISEDSIPDSFFECVRRYVKTDDATIGEAISEIYHFMNYEYRNEYYYKNTILNQLLIKKHDLYNTAALTELPIGNSKADFIMINDRGVVYEIKTDLDNLIRLENQLKDYYKVFSYIYVVVGNKQLPHVKEFLKDQKVGIYELTASGRLICRKKAFYNRDNLSYGAMFQVLRKAEFESIILKHFHRLPEVNNFQYYRECKKWLERINIVTLQKDVMKCLKARTLMLINDIDFLDFIDKAYTYMEEYRHIIAQDIVPRGEKILDEMQKRRGNTYNTVPPEEYIPESPGLVSSEQPEENFSKSSNAPVSTNSATQSNKRPQLYEVVAIIGELQGYEDYFLSNCLINNKEYLIYFYPQYITNALQEAIRLKKATNIYVYKKEKNILFYKLAAPKK